MLDITQFPPGPQIGSTANNSTEDGHDTSTRRVPTLLTLPFEIRQSILTHAISQERTIHIHKPKGYHTKPIQSDLTHSIRNQQFYHQAQAQPIYDATIPNNTSHLWSEDLEMCFHKLWTRPATEAHRLSCPYRIHIDILFTCRQLFMQGRHLLWSTNKYHFDDPTVFANVLSRTGMEANAIRGMSISLDWRHFSIRSRENKWGTALTWRTVLATPFIGTLCRLKILDIKLTNDKGLPMPRLRLLGPKKKGVLFDLLDDLSKLPLESACVYVPSIERLTPNPWFLSAPWLPRLLDIEDRPTRDVADYIASKLMGGDHNSARK